MIKRSINYPLKDEHTVIGGKSKQIDNCIQISSIRLLDWEDIVKRVELMLNIATI
jgi:hypothetical protein